MTSTSETGHAKNVANFQDLISFVTAYGPTYNPAQQAIKLNELNILHTNAKNALNTVHTKLAVFIDEINKRQLAFEPLNKLTTRLIAALDASGPTQKIVADARTFARKITGARKSKKILTPNPDDPKSISASQQSYDMRLENFRKLIELLKIEPLYNPNETDLKIASLNSLASDLELKNTHLTNANTDLSNARIARNNILYTQNTGLYDIQFEVKKYVKSVFGASSPQYNQIKSIIFTMPSKIKKFLQFLHSLS